MFLHAAFINDGGRVNMAKKRKAKLVLIIEDEVDVRVFVSRTLELAGYHVLQATDGEEGMKIVRESPIALVLLDLRLPGRDGWSVLSEIKSDAALSMIPVVMLTASAGVTHRNKALCMGAVEYLTKPLGVARLREAVCRILRYER